MNLLSILMLIPGVHALLKRINKFEGKEFETELFGLKFPNKVGLAAGFDKNGEYIHLLDALGFGHIEVGTITPKAQDGNPKPRLFRLKKDEAIINRMGFNNDGVEVLAKRLENRPKGIIIGANIGKNKVTPNERAVDDYVICFERLFDLVDYFTVNVSSPNTPGLRELQDKEPLKALLSELQDRNQKKKQPKPILLKIAPDLTTEQLDDIVEILGDTGIDGVVATNTTISRDNLLTSKSKVEAIGNGGLSGKPLTAHANDVVAYLSRKSEGKFPIIGVGGIMNSEDAEERIKSGAAMVQVWTGFVYGGPGMVREVAGALQN